MSIIKIKDKQYEFDKNHGWIVSPDDIEGVINIISEDLIGLIGEVGEFSNLIKKIKFSKNNNNTLEFKETFMNLKDDLSEELIDSLIYILRISNHLDLNIELEYEKKLNFNKKKYESYEK